jgi:hypothetical protein
MSTEHESAELDGTCEGTTKNSQRCRGIAMQGSRYCFFHNPATEKARKAAQQRGGRANRAAVLPVDVADVRLETPRDIAILFAQTINQVRKGQIAPKVAGTIGYLAFSLGKVLETSNLEERIARLEKAQKARMPEASLFDPCEDGEAINGNESEPQEN